MRKLIILLSLAPLFASFGQDLFWTFQWGSDRYGLIFADINLSASVKGAIRSDIELVLSFVPKNETEFYTFEVGVSSPAIYMEGKWRYVGSK